MNQSQCRTTITWCHESRDNIDQSSSESETIVIKSLDARKNPLKYYKLKLAAVEAK